MARNRTLADGQLATASASLMSGADVPSGHASIVLQNTGDNDETITLLLQVAGGTARRVARGVLATDEQMIVSGLPIQADDTLLGYTTTASAVDYVVFGTDREELRVTIYDANGVARRRTLGSQVISGDINVDASPSVEDLLEETNSVLRQMLLLVEATVGSEVSE